MANQEVSKQCLPILVGLSGKRNLGARDDAVRVAVERALQVIDDAFPHSPKVLLTGLAEGADMVVTELALKREAWRGFALLPTERAAYLATFSDDAARAHFTRLLEDPKLTFRTLAPLREGTRRESGSHGPEYEQLGLWLAENTTILLAIMPGTEQPDRLGGTARVVSHRLRGEADPLAEDVIDHSEELAHPPLLHPPDPQPVMLIDLESENTGELPILLRTHPPEHASRAKDRRADTRSLRRTFATAFSIDVYNRSIGRSVKLSWPPVPDQIIDTIRRFRSGLSVIQRKARGRWVLSVRLVSVLFLLAVALFEGMAKFTTDWPFARASGVTWWGGTGYALAVFGALLIYILAWWGRWQPLHQDYRAVNEVLRVQMAWWAAGLVKPQDRADRQYLVGAGGTLRRVRRFASAVINWLELRGYHAVPEQTEVESWITGQIEYFERNAVKREKQLRAAVWLSWGSFSLAFGLALWLAIYTAGAKDMLAGLAHLLNESQFNWAALLGSVLLVFLLVSVKLGRTVEPYLPILWTICAAAGFTIVAASLKSLSVVLAPDLGDGPKTLIIVAQVLLLALAGTVRFFTEKMVWEAEGHTYAEALRRFEEAKRRLDRIKADAPADYETKRLALVRALGTSALAESSAWLRAHRERPVEPVVGG
jgi:hypothetical protein